MIAYLLQAAQILCNVRLETFAIFMAVGGTKYYRLNGSAVLLITHILMLFERTVSSVLILFIPILARDLLFRKPAFFAAALILSTVALFLKRT